MKKSASLNGTRVAHRRLGRRPVFWQLQRSKIVQPKNRTKPSVVPPSTRGVVPFSRSYPLSRHNVEGYLQLHAISTSCKVRAPDRGSTVPHPAPFVRGDQQSARIHRRI